MRERFRALMHGGRTVLLDGAMGTQLVARGVVPSAAANVTDPDAVAAVHRAYREAGADVLITNSFGANPGALARSNDADQLERYIGEACRLAREAAGEDGYVAGDIGPTGEFLEPYGTMKPETMQAAFEASARALAAGGVDFFLVETMFDVKELALAVAACRAAAPDLPVAATMAFDPARDGYRTNTGVTVTDGARAMAQTGADIIGANCGSITPEQMSEVVRSLRGASDRPILAQANAGLPVLEGGEAVYHLMPEDFARGGLAIRNAGAQYLGGCCGTGPDHIRALREALRGAG